MTTLREAVAQALDALTKIHPGNMSWETGEAWLNAVQILRAALAQPEPEPFGYFQYSMHLDAWVQNKDEGKGVAFYTTPPQRKPLTDDEIRKLWDSHTIEVYGKIGINPVLFARYLERAHGIGGEE